MLVVVFCDPLYFCGVFCNLSFFISDFIDLGPLHCIFLMNLGKDLSVLFNFSKNQLLISLILSIFVSIHLFLVLFEIFLFSWSKLLNSVLELFLLSHKFWIVMFSFAFISRYFFISCLISSVMHWLFSSILFSLHLLCFFS